MSDKKTRLAIIIGHILDHYDTALFIFLSPLIGKLFFPIDNPQLQNIFAYSIVLCAWITRPLGRIYFSYLSINKGVGNILSYTILGTGIITGLISFLPIYSQIGIISPILIVVLRIFQGFFTSAEKTIGSLSRQN